MENESRSWRWTRLDKDMCTYIHTFHCTLQQHLYACKHVILSGHCLSPLCTYALSFSTCCHSGDPTVTSTTSSPPLFVARHLSTLQSTCESRQKRALDSSLYLPTSPRRYLSLLGVCISRSPKFAAVAMSGSPPASTRAILPTARSSTDSKRDNRGEGADGDPLSDGPERPSDEVGLDTIRPPPPPLDEVCFAHLSIPFTDQFVPQLSIHAIAQRGDTLSLSRLYESDPSIDLSSRDSQDVTALHWAAINAHIGTCRFLLDHGADVDAVGGDLKASPIQWAARNGHLYVVHLLLSRGADPNIRDDQGFNTLHLITHSSAVMPLLYMVCRCFRLSRPLNTCSCINPLPLTRRIPMDILL